MTEVEEMLVRLTRGGGGMGSRGILLNDVLESPQEDTTSTQEDDAGHLPRWSLLVFPTRYQALHRNILRMASQMCEESGFFEELRQQDNT